MARSEVREADRKTILVADDNDDVRELVAVRLRRAGYAVLTAQDGEQALRIAGEQRPDACVLDIMMPGIDGLEVLRRMHSTAGLEATPTILLTASVHEAAVEKGREAGAFDYIRKPFSSDDLLARVAAALAAGERGRRGARPLD